MKYLIAASLLMAGCRHEYRTVLEPKRCPPGTYVHGASSFFVDEKTKTIHVTEYSYYCGVCAEGNTCE